MRTPIGVDTTWLVHVSSAVSPQQAAAQAALVKAIAAGDMIALTPQALNEFVHAVTDARRFPQPLSMDDALNAVDEWWSAPEVVHRFPTHESVRLGWEWMRRYKLGRKRILDTQLAALFHVHGIDRILTTNARDFAVFGCFTIL